MSNLGFPGNEESTYIIVGGIAYPNYNNKNLYPDTGYSLVEVKAWEQQQNKPSLFKRFIAKFKKWGYKRTILTNINNLKTFNPLLKNEIKTVFLENLKKK